MKWVAYVLLGSPVALAIEASGIAYAVAVAACLILFIALYRRSGDGSE